MDYLGTGNVVCVGMTRFGKSYMIKKTLKDAKQGVLYFNTKHETSDLQGYCYADKQCSIKTILMALKGGKKINYVPSDDTKTRDLELKFLIDKMLCSFTESRFAYIAIDEVHMYRESMIKNKIIDLATIGISKGVRVCGISQRLAYMNKSLVTQSDTMIMFYTGMETSYFKSYNMPYDEIYKRINGEKHKFVVYTRGRVEGAFKL